MESTCKKEKCYWWKKMKDDCPLYIIGRWESDGGISIKVEDCAPVRNTLQLRTIHNLIVGLQKTSNIERNTVAGVLSVLLNKRDIYEQLGKRLPEVSVVRAIESANCDEAVDPTTGTVS